MATFASRLYAKTSASRDPDENFAISPLLIYQSLILARAASAGETEAQINQLLSLPEVSALATTKELHECALETTQSAFEIWTELTGHSTLDLVDGLFVSKAFPLGPRFSNRSDWYVGNRIHPVPFTHRPTRARNKINRWIKKSTNGRTNGLLEPKTVPPSTKALLISAIYFNGVWPHALDEKLTKKRSFLLRDGRIKMVSSMQILSELRVLDVKNKGYRAVNLPFNQKALSITFILPINGVHLHTIESKIDFDSVARAIDKLPMRKAKLTLPRFQVQPGSALSMRRVLAELGMKDAFDPSQADFFRLTRSEKPFALQDVLHSATIVINENAELATTAPQEEGAPPPTLAINRPFLFFVHHKTNRSVFFAGRVVDPQEPKNPGKGKTRRRRAKRSESSRSSRSSRSSGSSGSD